MGLAHRPLALTGAAAVIAAGAVIVAPHVGGSGGGYHLQLVFPSAANIVNGLKVQVGGFDAGQVTGLKAQDGQAVVTVSLRSPYDKVPQGSTAQIEWKALLGERLIDLDTSRAHGPTLPSGAMLRGDDRVEIDQLLAALDAPTRAKLSSSIEALDSAVTGRGDDLNATLEQLGPAISALGTVLNGAGADGPAIKDLVSRSSTVMQILQSHSVALRSSIANLDAQQSALVTTDTALSQSLDELPSTLEAAQRALGKVPGAVAAAQPVLTGLTAAVAQLPAFTGSLSPLLGDLNPTLAQTRLTVQDLSKLLGITPGLLTSGTQLLPQINDATSHVLPALSFLRPYTPEITGFFTNWGSAGSQYLGRYHVGRIKAQEGTTTPIGVLSSPPAGVTTNLTPAPGSNVGQAWTDANGDRVR